MKILHAVAKIVRKIKLIIKASRSVQMESIQSKFLKAILRIINLKKMWELTGDELKEYIEKKQSSEGPEPRYVIQQSRNTWSWKTWPDTLLGAYSS